MVFFFLWRDGQKQKRVTFSKEEKRKGLVLFYYLGLKCYKISRSFCFLTVLAATFETDL